MGKLGFDNDKYLSMQSEHIRERIAQFGGKLYLEFGGKLFDDYHASRVLPGFQRRTARSVCCMQLQRRGGDRDRGLRERHRKEQAARRPRHQLRRRTCLRLMDAFRALGLYVGSIVVTQYAGQRVGRRLPEAAGDAGREGTTATIPSPAIPPTCAHIVSDEGYGKNDYIETTRSLVVVTAPGPGSGKMATCLCQLYHEHKRGVARGLRQVRDLPDLEPAAQASGQPRLRGGDRRPERCEHDRPVPPRGLRRDDRQLQPRRGDLPRAARDVREDPGQVPLSSLPPTWA